MPADVVFIRGIEFEANHGYTAEERKKTRRFRVNIELATNLRAAAQSDRLKDTIDYGKICDITVRIGTRETFRLLEALAGRIGKAIQEEHPRAALSIEIEKLAPPCPGVPEACGIRLHLEPRSFPVLK
jgi:dihydroneopterin aldolase